MRLALKCMIVFLFCVIGVTYWINWDYKRFCVQGKHVIDFDSLPRLELIEVDRNAFGTTLGSRLQEHLVENKTDNFTYYRPSEEYPAISSSSVNAVVFQDNLTRNNYFFLDLGMFYFLAKDLPKSRFQSLVDSVTKSDEISVISCEDTSAKQLALLANFIRVLLTDLIRTATESEFYLDKDDEIMFVLHAFERFEKIDGEKHYIGFLATKRKGKILHLSITGYSKELTLSALINTAYSEK